MQHWVCFKDADGVEHIFNPEAIVRFTSETRAPEGASVVALPEPIGVLHLSDGHQIRMAIERKLMCDEGGKPVRSAAEVLARDIAALCQRFHSQRIGAHTTQHVQLLLQNLPQALLHVLQQLNGPPQLPNLRGNA